jgi:hypothetical protein
MGVEQHLLFIGVTVMAKNHAKAPLAPRAPRSKTPAQLGKRNRNIEAARLRLEKLQAKQKLARQLRERHPELTGTVDQIVETYLAFVEKEVADMLAAKVQAAMAAVRAKYVAEALSGPSACHLKRFLAGRSATFERVDAFFNRSGLPRVAPLTAKAA